MISRIGSVGRHARREMENESESESESESEREE